MKAPARFGILLCILGSATAAHASAPQHDAPARPSAPSTNNEADGSDVALAAHVGGFRDADDNGGGILGASGLFRIGPLAAGGSFETGGGVFDYSYVGAGLLGGVSYPVSRHVRFDLLGSLGARHYTGVGLLSDDPGASGSTAYAGARAGASYAFGTASHRFQLGLSAGLDEDLERKTVRYRYMETGWFGGETSERDSEQTVGTRRASLLISLGSVHDLL